MRNGRRKPAAHAFALELEERHDEEEESGYYSSLDTEDLLHAPV